MDNEQLLKSISDMMDKKLDDRFNSIDDRFNSIDARFESIDDRFNSIDARFESVDARFKSIDDRLESMPDMMDKKLDARLKPVIDRLDVIEYKQDRTQKKLEDLKLDVAVAGRDIRHDIHELKEKMDTVVEVLKMNELLPR